MSFYLADPFHFLWKTDNTHCLPQPPKIHLKPSHMTTFQYKGCAYATVQKWGPLIPMGSFSQSLDQGWVAISSSHTFGLIALGPLPLWMSISPVRWAALSDLVLHPVILQIFVLSEPSREVSVLQGSPAWAQECSKESQPSVGRWHCHGGGASWRSSGEFWGRKWVGDLFWIFRIPGLDASFLPLTASRPTVSIQLFELPPQESELEQRESTHYANALVVFCVGSKEIHYFWTRSVVSSTRIHKTY